MVEEQETVICPACGGANPKDAVFCANNECHKALGEFKYVYPYSLLGIILAIEAILITGFVLISQSCQYAYSEKRAELDYEVSIRSYRKLIELEKRLEQFTASRSKEE